MKQCKNDRGKLDIIKQQYQTEIYLIKITQCWMKKTSSTWNPNSSTFDKSNNHKSPKLPTTSRSTSNKTKTQPLSNHRSDSDSYKNLAKPTTSTSASSLMYLSFYSRKNHCLKKKVKMNPSTKTIIPPFWTTIPSNSQSLRNIKMTPSAGLRAYTIFPDALYTRPSSTPLSPHVRFLSNYRIT